MSRPIELRSDFKGADLRRLAKASKDADQTRRLLSLALIYDGGTRTQAAQLGDVGLQIIRDWVLRFNDRGAEGLITGRGPGPSSKLNDEHRQFLVALVESGPTPAIHGIVRWRLKDLAHQIWERYGISLDETTVGRELKALGYVKLTARPRHRSQNEFAVDDFKKNSRPNWRGSVQDCQKALK